MMHIDVVIPTYMETENLATAIGSCKSQTIEINRIFVVDDGSDNKTRLWIESNFGNDPQVTLIFNKHTGLPSVGRVSGIERSKAEWIAFLDADDIWHPEKIKKQIEFAISEKTDFIYTNATQLVNGKLTEKLLTKFPTKLSFTKLVQTNSIINSSVLMKRDLFSKELSYATSVRVRAVEDYATWLRVSLFCEMKGLDEELTYYRISEKGLSRSEEYDPKIYAYADFLIWSKNRYTTHRESLVWKRLLVLMKMVQQYGR